MVVVNITIFGGSSPKPENPAYRFAYELGKALAGAGHVVITGGYMGTMEATSRGASENGGHVIGVTCDEIENWRKAAHNAWVKEVWRESTLQDRIIRLIDACDAAIALPGGPGTLAEVTLMWNRMQIQSITKRPIILVGNGWKKTLQTFFVEQAAYIKETSKEPIHFVSTIEETLTILNHLH